MHEPWAKTPTLRQPQKAERESLKERETNSLGESRMVLPGIQATFGFQLIAVFNEHFWKIDRSLQLAHFASLCFLVVAVALIMTPAAYDRIVDSEYISEHFVRLTARLMTLAMAVFALGLCVELYVVTAVITQSATMSLLASIGAGIVFSVAWFALPFRARGATQRVNNPAL